MQKEIQTEVKTSTVSKTRVLIGTQLGAMAIAASFGILMGQMVAENNGDLVPDADYYLGVDYLNDKENGYYFTDSVQNTSLDISVDSGELELITDSNIASIKAGEELAVDVQVKPLVIEDISEKEERIVPGNFILNKVDENALDERFSDEEYAVNTDIVSSEGDTITSYLYNAQGEYERYVPAGEADEFLFESNESGGDLEFKKEEVGGLKNVVIMSINESNVIKYAPGFDVATSDDLISSDESGYSLIGRGDAEYLVSGKLIRGYWIIGGEDNGGGATVEFYTLEGQRMGFSDGKTYVEVVDEGQVQPIVKSNQ